VLVTVVVNGSFVPSVPVAGVDRGRVVGPVSLVARFAERVAVREDGRTLVAVRGERTCTANALPGTDPPLVVIAPLARCLGADVAWDGQAKSLALRFGGEAVMRTLPPFDPSAPQVAPTMIFTPEPAPPTPRVISTGSPRPRRTAIPLYAPPFPSPVMSPRP
jgi:hypothetical protein